MKLTDNSELKLSLLDTHPKLFRLFRQFGPVWGSIYSATALILFFTYVPEIEILRPIMEDTFIFISVLVTLALTGFMAGYGMSGLIQTIAIYFRLSDMRLKWHPFHYDNAGGFSFLGDFAIKTSLSFTAGAVVLPATIELSRAVSHDAAYIGWAFAIVFSVAVTLIYTIPFLLCANTAQKLKEYCLSRVYAQIVEVLPLYGQRTLRNPCLTAQDTSWLELLVNIDARIRQSSIFPFSSQSLFRAFTYSLVPIVVTVVQELATG